jgi:O-antigen ligase
MGGANTERTRLLLPPSLRLLLTASVVAAFFTGTRFFGGIENNFGAFEVVGAVLIAAFGVFLLAQKIRLRMHPVIFAVIFVDIIAALSMSWLPPESVRLGVIQVLILLFLTCVLITFYNLLIVRAVNLVALLRLIAVTALVVGLWIFLQGGGEGESLEIYSGPFRNRAHMGLHFLTILWMVLLLAVWPGRPALERVVALSAVPLLLYGIAGAGRRSVYLSLFVGGALLIGVAGVAGRRGRVPLLLVSLGATAFLVWYYAVAPEFSQRARFFRDRVGLIGSRIDMAAASREEVGPDEYNFLLLQREGALRAFADHPFLGIGWSGFLDSPYNPTHHEIHPTPLRFLAETGVIGLAAYGIFIGLIVITALRTAHLAKSSPYRLASLVTATAVLGLVFSWAYNRHIHERTFWIFVAIVLALENYVLHWRSANRLRSEGEKGLRAAPRGEWTASLQ